MVEPEVLRGRVAHIVAATRYPFVDQENWDESRRVIVNTHKSRGWGFDSPAGRLYPSVVVLEEDGSVRELGVVEVKHEFTVDDAQRWSRMSSRTGMGVRYKKLFLYVPKGSESEALRLLEENSVEYAGLRAWWVTEGQLKVEAVETPDMPYDHRDT